ncbi:MAG: DUF4846 domain-containing protein [Lutisporaceae bacterium]
MKKIFWVLIAITLLVGCTDYQAARVRQLSTMPVKPISLINEQGNTIEERIQTPAGFDRITVEENSFGDYLRGFPLKTHGSTVKYYNGNIKSTEVYVAVLDIDIGDKDLQQCADAVMRLRAEYLYQKGEYDNIHFNFTNGFRADYSKWRSGYRVAINGNNTSWVKKNVTSDDYQSFRKYLDVVFAYAGTLSLSKELQKVSVEDMQIGDVFIKGGSPGHCVIVVDMAENMETGEKLFLLAQSYMPAQDIHILKSTQNDDGNPWYSLKQGEALDTPEWNFNSEQLMRF